MTLCRMALLVLFVLTTKVHAQSIRWKPEFLTPGDFVILDQSQGARVHLIYKGRTGNTFILEKFFGESPKGDPALTHHLDQHGNGLRDIMPNGSSITYQPHDCARTLGTCTFIQIAADGEIIHRTRRTSQTPLGFSYKLYDANWDLVEEGAFHLVERGFTGEGWVKMMDGWDIALRDINFFSFVASDRP